MNASADYHQPVLEALCAFVRDSTIGMIVNKDGPATDVQAALTVIGRRKSGPGRVDLTRANIPGAALARADLSDANLSGADLARADLSDANLTGVDLLAAHLIGAHLIGDELESAHLNGAELSRADLRGSHLRSSPT
jgi:hypothetical protein